MVEITANRGIRLDDLLESADLRSQTAMDVIRNSWKNRGTSNMKSLKPAKALSADLVTDNEVLTLRVSDPVNITPVLLRC